MKLKYLRRILTQRQGLATSIRIWLKRGGMICIGETAAHYLEALGGNAPRQPEYRPTAADSRNFLILKRLRIAA